jgi:ligand-binding SRPBCC domain-containing protein
VAGRYLFIGNGLEPHECGTSSAMGIITRDTHIEAPPEVVWSVMEDVQKLPDLSPSTEAVEDAPPRLDAVGQTYVQVGRLLGRRLRSVWTVKARTRPASCGWP